MVIKKQDLFAPANLLSFAGLGLVVYGCLRLNTLPGVIFIVAGRLLDIFDGHVARHTHTSPLGAALDAVLDKLAVAFIVVAAIGFGLLPWPVITWVAGRNAINAVMALVAKYRHKTIAVSLDGKHAMFFENLALGLFILGGVLPPSTSRTLSLVAATVAILLAVPAGLRTLVQYARQIAD